MAKLSALDIAKYFLAKIDEEYGDNISNLKLQKLVYYAQGFHLAIFNKALFSESIEAWEHGPVIPSLYQRFRKHGSGPIPKPQKISWRKYNKNIKELLDDIYDVFGQYSAWKLRNMTHVEPPWENAYPNGLILRKAMKKYFKTQLA